MTKRDEAQLIREVRETRLLVEAVLAGVVGVERGKKLKRRCEQLLEADPLDCEVAIWRIGLAGGVAELYEAGYRTLQDLADAGKTKVQAVPRIGRVSIGRIESAFSEHNLTWSVAV